MALKLLIAEDEELERRALCRFVKDIEEVEVVAEARNGLEAVQLAALTHPDLALIDIKMPGLSGLRVIKEISAFCPAMKAIIITAYEDFDFAHEALRLGAMDYLLKPSPKEDVQAAVRRAADAVRREQARQRVEEQLKATAPSVLTALVLDLISGAQLAPQNLAERASLAGLSRLPTVALAVGVDPPASPDREGDWQEQRKRVHGIVSRTCVERLCCVAIPTGAEDLAVIFGTDGDDEAESLRLAEQLRSAVAAATGITVTVGVGRPAAEPGLLSESYKSALAAVRLGRLIHGTDRVIHADQLARPASAHAPALLELEQELEERVRWGDSPAAAVAADRLLQAYLGSSGLSPEGLRIRLLELAVVLSRAVGEAGVDRQAGTSVTAGLVRGLEACRTADQYREWVMSMVEQLLALVTESCKTQSAVMVKRVQHFVKKHLAEPIRVPDMANMVHLDPSYFCRVFKRETGSTFVDYLTEVRLEHARDLLAHTSEPIGSVARMAGYDDANYFSRVFVRRTHETPLEFRKRVRQSASVD